MSQAKHQAVGGTDRQANYPIPRPEHDARFTIGLLIKVSRVLKEAGFPEATGFDLMELGQALIGFVYAAAPEAEGPRYRCASPDCPGYPYRASDMAHPCGQVSKLTGKTNAEHWASTHGQRQAR